MHYRREIDGLRAVAVIPVILFHAGVTGLRGGFVGVDIFFVISGYLITAILMDEVDQGRFSIARFYERRIRRILPALAVVLAATLPFAWAWMLPAQFSDFCTSLIYVVFSASNIHFWLSGDYFAGASNLKPLLHTWSLAVEEQYYLFFPLLLHGLWRFGRVVAFRVILALAVVSLAGSEVVLRLAPEANFYLTPTRAWELFAGSLCAFAGSGRVRGSNLWAGLGLFLIVLSMLVIREGTPFPGLYTLVPVGGAVLIILFGTAGTWVARVLSTKVLVGVGLISYSAYLWHQPIFALTRIRMTGAPSPGVMAACVGLTLILAWASWRFVEQPFRARGAGGFRVTRGPLYAVTGVAMAGFVAIGAFGLTQTGQALQWQGDDPQISALLAYETYDKAHFAPGCFLSSERNDLALFDRDKCLHMATDRPNVLLLGNSHSAHLAEGLRKTYPQVNFLQASASGCSGLLPLRGQRRCTDLMDLIHTDFLPTHQVDAIIFSARISAEDVGQYPATIEHLAQWSRTGVLVVGPTFEFEPALYMIMLNAQRFGAEGANVQPYLVADRAAVDADLAKALAGQAGTRYLSVIQQFCQPGCPVWSSGGELFSFDYGHYTRTAAEDVAAALRGDLVAMGVIAQ